MVILLNMGDITMTNINAPPASKASPELWKQQVFLLLLIWVKRKTGD